MKKIWLVRHAQSQAQTKEDIGNLEPGLSTLGKEQAKRLVKPLKDIEFDCILISPLKRAWQTYELARVRSDIARFDGRLVEGGWEGEGWVPPGGIVSPPDIAKPDRHSEAWLKSGEERSKELLSDLLEKPENNILLFGHIWTFANFFRVFANVNTADQPIFASMDNTGISLLTIGGTLVPTISYWNDRAHVIDLLE